MASIEEDLKVEYEFALQELFERFRELQHKHGLVHAEMIRTVHDNLGRDIAEEYDLWLEY